MNSHVMADNARLPRPGAVTAEDSMGRGSLMAGGWGMLVVVVIVRIYHDRKGRTSSFIDLSTAQKTLFGTGLLTPDPCFDRYSCGGGPPPE